MKHIKERSLEKSKFIRLKQNQRENRRDKVFELYHKTIHKLSYHITFLVNLVFHLRSGLKL